METFHLSLEKTTRIQLEHMLKQTEKKGDIRGVKRIQAILAAAAGHASSVVASILNVYEKTVNRWIEAFLHKGPQGLESRKSPGRKPNLTKSQKKELGKIIEKGPLKAGFPGACWRSPMIQSLIYENFGVLYSVHYISQLLKSMGFSFQKARFVAARRDIRERKEWLKIKWPQIFRRSEEKNALVLFGDEASFPQWGTLTHTWSRRGHQYIAKTSGIRRSYKVFGLIEYFSGRFFFKCHEGRLNSETYICFLKEVMRKTRQHIILIQDKAPYHTSRATGAFIGQHSDRLTLYDLPSYSPDYNPIEMLWKKIKEKETHLHYFPTFKALKKKVNEALIRFENLKDEVLSLFGFYNRLPREILSSAFTINFNIKVEIKISVTD